MTERHFHGNFMRIKTSLSLALWLGLTINSGVKAQGFDDALSAAKSIDAQYRAALSAVSQRRIQVSSSKSAFYPSANANIQRPDLRKATTSDTNQIAISLPLLSYEKYLTLLQAEPFEAISEAELLQAQSDLALRVFKSMSDIIRFREAIRASDVQIDGLDAQLRRAQRMRELGQGTVTEVSDFEVRLAVAQANRVSQRSSLDAAVRTFGQITGITANVSNITVSDAAKFVVPKDHQGFADAVREASPSIIIAKQNVALQDIAAKRTKADYLPQIYATASRSRSAGAAYPTNSTALSLTFSAPLGIGNYYAIQQAAEELTRQKEVLSFAQTSIGNQALSLLQSATSLESEVNIRKRAVESAKLSLDGNLKSYQAGVKSNIDVVTSYQYVADTEVALVGSQLSLVETLLNLKLLLPIANPEALR